MLADPDGLADMSRAARTCYEENYTAATNLEMLLAIYRKASESVLTSRIEKGQSGPGVGQ
jgi:hypothetical protein